MKEDPTQHFSGNFTVKAIIEKGDAVLLCRGIGDDILELPGGRLHDGEQPRDGIAREIQEELGIDIEVGPPVHICRSFHVKEDKWQLITAFSCSLGDEDAEIRIDPDEIEEYKWVKVDELEQTPMFFECKELVMEWLKQKKK